MNTFFYKQSAKCEQEAFVSGNGRLGACVYGNVSKDVIPLFEESLWSSPYTDRNNRCGAKDFAEICKKKREGKSDFAMELAQESLDCSSPTASYGNAGSLVLNFFADNERTYIKDEHVAVYERSLDLETGLVSTEFSFESSAPNNAIFARRSDGSSIKFSREVISSFADDVIAIHLSSSVPNSLYFRASLEKSDCVTKGFSLDNETIVMESISGIPFSVIAMASVSGGTCTVKGNAIIVESADEATIYVDVESAYRNSYYRRCGGRLSRSLQSFATWCTDKALKKLCFVASKSYQSFRDDHVAYYLRRYKRTSLSLTDVKKVDISLLKEGTPEYAQALWNYTRYMLLSCSSSFATLPALSSGLWKNSAGYDLGELCFLYSRLASLSMEDALFTATRFINRLSKRGKKTARLVYGKEGWVSHRNSDIWADSAVYGIKDGKSLDFTFGISLCLLLKEYYDYTLDKKFLKKIYPIIRDVCVFAESVADYGLSRKTLDELEVLCSFLAFADHLLCRAGSDFSFAKTCVEDGVEHLAKETTVPNLLGKVQQVYEWTDRIAKGTLEKGVVCIELLNTLPPELKTGELIALHLPGNLRLNLVWENGEVKSGRIYAKKGASFIKSVKVMYKGKSFSTDLQAPSLELLNILPSVL